MQKSSSDKFYIQSLHRAFYIVDIISISDSGLTLTVISDEIKLPISTVYRILQNLIAWKYIKEDENGIYTLGLELITLGSISNKNIGVKDIAQKYINDLSVITKETIYLTILDEQSGEIIYIDKKESKKNIQLSSGVGNRNCIHATANGKVLVSQFNDDKIINLLKIKGTPKLTENTITDINELLELIRSIKASGYYIDELENEPEVRCIAAPIFDYRKKIVASLSISGIASQVTKEIIDEKYRQLIIDATERISSELGYRK